MDIRTGFYMIDKSPVHPHSLPHVLHRIIILKRAMLKIGNTDNISVSYLNEQLKKLAIFFGVGPNYRIVIILHT